MASDNGFSIRSWRDVAALATVLSLAIGAFVGLLLWGLKLDARTERLQVEQAQMEMELRELRRTLRKLE